MGMTLREMQEQTGSRRSWRAVICGWPLGFLTALQFLTVAPPLVRRPLAPEELGRAVGWFALVGSLLGIILAGADMVLRQWLPPGVAAALLLVLWTMATGALHLDGWLDSCDGLFGGQTPEARLRIMRDERAGAFAVIGGILLLLVKYSCLAELSNRTAALMVAPTAARWGMSVAVVGFPYARPEGLGRWMKDYSGWPQVVLSGITAFLVAALAARWIGLLVVAVAGITIVIGAAWVLRRLPGLTGDIYGAFCELLETLALLAFVAGERP